MVTSKEDKKRTIFMSSDRSKIFKGLKQPSRYTKLLSSDATNVCSVLQTLNTMRIWHWQSHWKTSEITLKSFTKDNHTGIFSFITLKYVCYCYLRMLIPYNQTETYWQIFSATYYPLFSSFSALLWFFSVIFSVIILIVQTPKALKPDTNTLSLYHVHTGRGRP